MKLQPRRFVVAIAATGAIALAAAGCGFTHVSASQPLIIGPISVDAPFSTYAGSMLPNGTQLLFAVRVPAAYSAPATLAVRANDLPPLALSQSASYQAELERLAPAAPNGEKWVGYLSDPFDIATPTSDMANLKVVFPLPKTADGSPFDGTFTYRAILGYRTMDLTHDSARPVVCNPTKLVRADTGDSSDISGDGGTTFCAVDPSYATQLTDTTYTPNDAAVLPGGAVPPVLPGDSTSVPFNLAWAGPANGKASFSIDVFSEIPASSPTASAASVVPQTGANALSVSQTVPVTTPPGTYRTLVVASLPNGQRRIGAQTITVSPLPAGAGPALVGGRTLRMAKNGTVKLGLGCPATAVDPCNGVVALQSAKAIQALRRARVSLKRILQLGRAAFSIAPGKQARVAIKLNKKARTYLRKKGRLAAKAAFVNTNRAGAKSASSQSLVIKAKKVTAKHRHHKHRKHSKH